MSVGSSPAFGYDDLEILVLITVVLIVVVPLCAS